MQYRLLFAVLAWCPWRSTVELGTGPNLRQVQRNLAMKRTFCIFGPAPSCISDTLSMWFHTGSWQPHPSKGINQIQPTQRDHQQPSSPCFVSPPGSWKWSFLGNSGGGQEWPAWDQWLAVCPTASAIRHVAVFFESCRKHVGQKPGNHDSSTAMGFYNLPPAAPFHGSCTGDLHLPPSILYLALSRPVRIQEGTTSIHENGSHAKRPFRIREIHNPWLQIAPPRSWRDLVSLISDSLCLQWGLLKESLVHVTWDPYFHWASIKLAMNPPWHNPNEV